MDDVLPLSMVSNGHDIRQDSPPNLFETDANKIANHQTKLSGNLRASPVVGRCTTSSASRSWPRTNEARRSHGLPHSKL